MDNVTVTSDNLIIIHVLHEGVEYKYKTHKLFYQNINLLFQHCTNFKEDYDMFYHNHIVFLQQVDLYYMTDDFTAEAKQILRNDYKNDPIRMIKKAIELYKQERENLMNKCKEEDIKRSKFVECYTLNNSVSSKYCCVGKVRLELLRLFVAKLFKARLLERHEAVSQLRTIFIDNSPLFQKRISVDISGYAELFLKILNCSPYNYKYQEKIQVIYDRIEHLIEEMRERDRFHLV